MHAPSPKEQHEIAIGNNLLKFLRCDSQLLRHGKDDGEPALIYSLMAGRWAFR
jgi:hypothetical protein